ARQAEEAAATASEAAALARQSAEEAGAEAESVRRASEQAGGGRDYESPPTLTPFRGHDSDGDRATPEQSDPRRPLFGGDRDTGPKRERRPGFDDVEQPMATIELDGRFRELNRAFSDLVGYSEQDFRSASWPPVMDRANLAKHREQMRQMLAGEIASGEVNTGYVHAQGLLVPVTGTITLVREGDEPDHFLLAASG
ncbi:MAG: PAS domain S-box protein, partial [Thermoleophilaceae bacterium]